VHVVVLIAELGGSPVPASSSLKSVLVIGGMIDVGTRNSVCALGIVNGLALREHAGPEARARHA
jgi:hypothetical protein